MSWLTASWGRIRALIARRRLDDEGRREIEAHLHLLTNRYIQAGLTADAARAAALRQFGNPTALREKIQGVNGIAWLDRFVRDLRLALRQIRRKPGYAAVVIVTLALGIGGTTAVFSVVQAVLFEPLPFRHPDQLVRLYQQEPGKPDTRYVLAAATVKWLREQTTTLDGVIALNDYSETGRDLLVNGEGRRIRVLQVTRAYFQTLEPRSALRGQDFTSADETGAPRVIVSDELWRTAFAAAPSTIARPFAERSSHRKYRHRAGRISASHRGWR